MGCGGSKESSAPAPSTGAASKPATQPDPEKLERRRREKALDQVWSTYAREKNPAPFPKPAFEDGSSEEAYKLYMSQKFEYEKWENQCILSGRKFRSEAEAAGNPIEVLAEFDLTTEFYS